MDPFEVVVEEVREEAAGVVSLSLAMPDGGPLPAWEPGAHVDLLLGCGLERQYSLCGDLADLGRWRVAVLREPDGRGGSAWVHDTLTAGERLMVRGPRNHFPLVDVAEYVFIAGGIGITPIIPMLSRAAGRGAPVRLLYGGRQASSMAFTEELARYGDAVQLWPEDRHGLLPLDDVLAVPRPDVAVYCCGPEALIAAVEDRCGAWPEDALHVERFRPRPGALDGPSTSFEVIADFSGLTVTVGPGESIADALEAAGVEVDTSCREGTCGTCETAVLEGVPDHRDSFLSPAEREENETMMICCSRALGARLVLDI